MLVGWLNECPFMMVEAGAQLNECTWGSMGSQPSDPADKVCMNFLRRALSRMNGHSEVNEQVFLFYV